MGRFELYIIFVESVFIKKKEEKTVYLDLRVKKVSQQSEAENVTSEGGK